jgi:GNAT superfamily N-acetyltransferase
MPLPNGYILRHPMPDEAWAVQAVLDAAETVDAGEPRSHPMHVATTWRTEECHSDDDWWVAVDADGTVAGVGLVWPETAGQVTADHYVRPDQSGRGLGEALLDTIEARAAELPALRDDGSARQLVVWCGDTDQTRRASLDRRGFVAVRQYYEMTMDLRAEPVPASAPAGIELRAFRAGGDDRATYEADLEAFAEHDLHEPLSYADWRLYHIDAPSQDTSLWCLA